MDPAALMHVTSDEGWPFLADRALHRGDLPEQECVRGSHSPEDRVRRRADHDAGEEDVVCMQPSVLSESVPVQVDLPGLTLNPVGDQSETIVQDIKVRASST